MSKVKSDSGKLAGRFLAIPAVLMQQKKFRALSPYARMLLQEMMYDYRGFNNGDLSATWSIMHQRGFRSRATLHKATKELLEAGLIIKTRQGGRNACSLYALTWRKIDECVHPRTKQLKFDTGIKPGVPPMTWKDGSGS